MLAKTNVRGQVLQEAVKEQFWGDPHQFSESTLTLDSGRVLRLRPAVSGRNQAVVRICDETCNPPTIDWRPTLGRVSLRTLTYLRHGTRAHKLRSRGIHDLRPPSVRHSAAAPPDDARRGPRSPVRGPGQGDDGSATAGVVQLYSQQSLDRWNIEA